MTKSIIEQAKENVEKKHQKEKHMSKSNKQPKTIKVSTVIISAAVLIALIAAFIGGIITANHYKDTVQAQAFELSKQIDRK